MTQSSKFPLILLIPAVAITALVSLWLGAQFAPATPTYLEQASAPQPSATSVTRDDTEKLIATLQQRIELLQRENQRLSLQQNLPLEKASPQPAATTADVKQFKDQINSLEIEKQKRKANDVNDWIMNKQKSSEQFNVNAELSRRFEQESIDPIWAEKQENYYRQLFSSKDSLHDFALRDAQCRSTQCEVTFSISSPEQSFQLLQTISNELQGTEILVATDKTQGTSKLYISSQKGFELN